MIIRLVEKNEYDKYFNDFDFESFDNMIGLFINNEIKGYSIFNIKNNKMALLSQIFSNNNDIFYKELYFSTINYIFNLGIKEILYNNKIINLNKKYSTILFDLDDTLFDFKASEKQAFFDTLKAFEIMPTENIYLKFSDINEELFEKFSRGEIKERITFQELRFKQIFEFMKIDLDSKKANQLFLNFLKNSKELYPNTVRVLRTLFKKYRLCVVTNGMEEVQIARLKSAGIFDYFSAIYASSKIGCNKPDKNFFKYILNHENNYNLDSYLIVGDREKTDMQGGINIGIDTCYFNPNLFKLNKIYTYEIKDIIELLSILKNSI